MAFNIEMITVIFKFSKKILPNYEIIIDYNDFIKTHFSIKGPSVVYQHKTNCK